MKKVLMIEDDEILRSTLLEVLRFEEYEAIGARNGSEGIASAQTQKPHLIICDLMMPGMSGFEVIRELRQDPQTAHIPVIFLSARKDQTAIQRGLQLGAVGYFVKPCSLNDLLVAIKAQIGD